MERTISMDLDKYIIPFGKYKGEYLGDVAADDPGYIEWVADNVNGEFGRKAEAMVGVMY